MTKLNRAGEPRPGSGARSARSDGGLRIVRQLQLPDSPPRPSRKVRQLYPVTLNPHNMSESVKYQAKPPSRYSTPPT